MGAVVVGEFGDVGGPAGRVPDRVEQDLDTVEPDVPVEAQAQLDQLRVDGRSGITDRLDVELPELAVAAGLRAVVAEHRPDESQLHRLRPRLHPVLDVGPHDPGGGLGAERPRLRLLGSRRDPEELLLDDIRDVADAALEDLGLLDERGLDLAVAVARGEVCGGPFQARPGGSLGGQQVARASRGLEARHQAESRASAPGDGIPIEHAGPRATGVPWRSGSARRGRSGDRRPRRRPRGQARPTGHAR